MQLDRYLQAGALFADALDSIQDLEGLGYTVASAPTVLAGPWGNAVNFDGTDDKVTVGPVSGTMKSIAFRCKVDSAGTTEQLVDLDGGTHYVISASLTVTATGWTSPTVYVDGVSASTLTAGKWHTVVITTATGFSPSNLQVGTDNTNFGAVAVRDLILFSTELSADEALDFADGTMFDYMQIIFSSYNAGGGLTYSPISDDDKVKISANTKSDDSGLGLTTFQLAAWNAEKGRL